MVLQDRIEAITRELRGLRQYRDKLAAGEMSEDDLLRLAIARAEREQAAQPTEDLDEPDRLPPLGILIRGDGAPLFDDPWWVGYYHDLDPIESTELPARQYKVRGRWSGTRLQGVYIDLDHEAFPAA